MEEEVTALTETTKAPPPEKGAAAAIEIGGNGVMLRSLEDLLRFARMAVSGGAAPKGMTEGQAAIAIQAGLERGLGPLGGLQQCVVINGVLSWRGQGAAALIQNSGKCKPGTLRFGCRGDGDTRTGWATAHRVGYVDPDTREFSVKDARQAHLWGKAGPWTDHPGRMLAWRALGFLVRDVFPDVLGGFPLAEEAEDFEPVRPERAAITAKEQPQLPSGPDPLLQALQIERPEPEAETVSDDPPAMSHEEADKELAKEEGLF